MSKIKFDHPDFGHFVCKLCVSWIDRFLFQSEVLLFVKPFNLVTSNLETDEAMTLFSAGFGIFIYSSLPRFYPSEGVIVITLASVGVGVGVTLCS